MILKRTAALQVLQACALTLLIAGTLLLTAKPDSLKRFGVVCGSAILEGILHLSPSNDKSWRACRARPVPVECKASCGGVELPKLSLSHERSCWLCENWRILVFGKETPWMWSPLLISACETLGFGSSQAFVDLFTSDSVLFQLALHSTLPQLLRDTGEEGGGGGAGIEMWCQGERFFWLGGGGGGGSSNSSRGRGSGAGVQTSFGWSLGAGGGGGIEQFFFSDSGNVRKRSFTFGYEKDDIENGTRVGTAHDVDVLKEFIKGCYRSGSLQVFGGGGSGGWDTSAALRFNMTNCDFRMEGLAEP